MSNLKKLLLSFILIALVAPVFVSALYIGLPEREPWLNLLELQVLTSISILLVGTCLSIASKHTSIGSLRRMLISLSGLVFTVPFLMSFMPTQKCFNSFTYFDCHWPYIFSNTEYSHTWWIYIYLAIGIATWIRLYIKEKTRP